MRIDAAVWAGSVVCRMPMVQEEVNVMPNLCAETSGVLPPDGGVQQQLKRELEKVLRIENSKTEKKQKNKENEIVSTCSL